MLWISKGICMDNDENVINCGFIIIYCILRDWCVRVLCENEFSNLEL